MRKRGMGYADNYDVKFTKYIKHVKSTHSDLEPSKEKKAQKRRTAKKVVPQKGKNLCFCFNL